MRKTGILLVLLLGALAFSEFRLGSLGVTIEVNKDGTAHVEERILMYLNSTDSINLYMGSLSRNDIATWKERIGLSDIRYHISSNYVEIKNLRVRPRPVEKCNLFQGTCEATLIFDYDINPYYSNGTVMNGTGIFSLEQFKPRTTRYRLNPAAISFDVTSGGDIMVPKDVTLAIIIPKDSSNIYVQPLPIDMTDMRPPLKGVSTFSWSNTILPKFDFSFEREESLESEVIGFFRSIQDYIASTIYGPQGLALIIIGAAAALSLVYLNSMKKKREKK